LALMDTSPSDRGVSSCFRWRSRPTHV